MPSIWIDGPAMYVSCTQVNIAQIPLTPKQESDWLRLVHTELRDKWDIDSNNLTIEYERDEYRYRINFNDDEEFVMTKLIHG